MSRYVTFEHSSPFRLSPEQLSQDFCEMGELTPWATHLGENRMKLVAVELVRAPLQC